METALYYTLSTVSQTLAGALGMLVAFLAIRAASLDATLKDALTELLDRAGADPRMRPASGSSSDLLRELDLLFGKTEDGWTKSTLLQAKHVHAMREALLSEARAAFVLSAVVMVACFAGLSCSPWIAGEFWRAVATLAAACVSGGGCLYTYGRLVLRALG